MGVAGEGVWGGEQEGVWGGEQEGAEGERGDILSQEPGAGGGYPIGLQRRT